MLILKGYGDLEAYFVTHFKIPTLK